MLSSSVCFYFANWNSVPIKQSFLSHPQPLANTTVLSIPMNWTPLGHVSGILQYLPACDRSISVSTTSSRFIHVVAGVRISIYFLVRFICLFLAAVGLRRWYGLSLVVVCGLLIAVASPVAEHALQAHGLQQLQHAGSGVVMHGLSCSAARGILPDQGSNWCPLHCKADA